MHDAGHQPRLSRYRFNGQKPGSDSDEPISAAATLVLLVTQSGIVRTGEWTLIKRFSNTIVMLALILFLPLFGVLGRDRVSLLKRSNVAATTMCIPKS